MPELLEKLSAEQGIVLYLCEILKEISIVKGYQTDAGTKVTHWRTEPFTDDVEDVIIVRDKLSQDENDNKKMGYPEIEIDIHAGCRNKTDLWKYTTDALNDIRRCIGKYKQQFMWNHQVEEVDLVSWGVVDITTSPIEAGEGVVTIRVRYISDAFLQYTTGFKVENA